MCNRSTLLYTRNYHNIVNKLYLNKKIILKNDFYVRCYCMELGVSKVH